jgi:hypothetical protein
MFHNAMDSVNFLLYLKVFQVEVIMNIQGLSKENYNRFFNLSPENLSIFTNNHHLKYLYDKIYIQLAIIQAFKAH